MMTMTTSSAKQPRPVWVTPVVGIAAVAALMMAALAAFILSGGPLANEWVCSQGYAPANNRAGGSACFKEGSDLPPGYTWDPAGNHPLR